MKKITNKVLLISPYLHIMGGGEQHILSILKVFDQHGFACDIVSEDENILKKLSTAHKITFNHARIVQEIPQGVRYEYCLYVTDGSYFFPKAQKTFVFLMYPKKELLPHGIINMIKTRGYRFFANGVFTAEKNARFIHKDIAVIHPYIDEAFFNPPTQKKQVILSVGRFFPHLHSKRQDVLVQAFELLQSKNAAFSKYSLILAGGLSESKEDQDYMKVLKDVTAKNSSISIKTNLNSSEILKLYKSANFYWHAAGYGLDESRHPEGVEHLGITPLEAMASGSIVFCHNSGGPKRYIQDGFNGYLYETIEDLVDKTSTAEKINNNSIRENGIEYVRENFSKEVFTKKVEEYFGL